MSYIPESVTRAAYRTLLKVQKGSPTLLFGVGLVGFAATIVLSSRATLKVGDILEDAESDLENINTLQSKNYSESDRKHDQITVYSRTAVKIAKLYLPAFSVGLLSVAALTGSYSILNARNVSLTAAYLGLEESFKKYRDRVRQHIGEDEENVIWSPVYSTEITNQEDGSTLVKDVLEDKGGSPYRVVFDEFNPNWNKAREYNQFFLQAQQNYANDMLRSKGFVFLNDVYDMLGFPRTKAGQIVGWLWNDKIGDGYIDFGVFRNSTDTAKKFAMGDERSVWLDFNVDGNILDRF